MLYSTEQIRQLHKIEQILSTLGYDDTQRIAKEVINYSEEHSVPLEQVISRLEKDEPWEYIQGFTYFCGYKFVVNRNVLIPRPETEVLVNKALFEIRKVREEHPEMQITVTDTGTGSGCIIISTALLLQEADMLENISFAATEISADALEVAIENSKIHGVDELIRFVNVDLIDPDLIQKDAYNIILANLPYVKPADLENLNSSVKDWEPHVALIGGGEEEDGLYLERKLLTLLRGREGKWSVFFEMDPSQIGTIAQIATQNYLEWQSFKDQYDRERFMVVTRN